MYKLPVHMHLPWIELKMSDEKLNMCGRMDKIVSRDGGWITDVQIDSASHTCPWSEWETPDMTKWIKTRDDGWTLNQLCL